MKRGMWCTVFALAGVLCTAQALAQSCNYNASSVNFGLIGGSPPSLTDTTGNIAISCTATPGTTVRVCLSIAAGTASGSTVAVRRLQLGNTTTTIDFNLYQDSARSIIWGSRASTPTYYPLTVDIPIPGSGLASANAPVYARISSGQPAKASGTYTNTFSGGSAGAEARLTLLSSGLTCGSLPQSPRTRFGFTASVAIGAACSLTANSLTFGVVLGLGVQRDATGSLVVACSLNTPYTIAMNGGATSNNISARKMNLGGVGSGVISYQLYRDSARSLVWGDGTTGTVASGTGNGSSQSLPVYARVFNQATPVTGDYEDTILVTLTY